MANGSRRIIRACNPILALGAGCAIIGPVLAQMPDAAGLPPPPQPEGVIIGGSPPAQRPESTIIGGQPSSAATFERCVEVEVGNDNAFGCLNQKLKREVDRVNPSVNTPPLDARSPDVAVGNVNEAAVREQYGPNFGRSAIPYRPPPPTFATPHR